MPSNEQFDPEQIIRSEDPIPGLIERLLETKGTPEQKRARALQLLTAFNVEQVVPDAAIWEEWLEENRDDSYDWIIPDLLERMERVIVVAAEGVGKTMLARQVAICAAAGLHPFTGAHMTPITTLTIDLENPKKIIQRTSRRIMRLARERTRLKSNEPIKAHLFLKPDGVNLLSQSGKDYVETIIKQVKPDILFMGPLYKSFIESGDRKSDAVATEIAMYYDFVRTEYDCALWLEQHAPLGNAVTGRDLRPFGSSVWSRWPEFGPTITKDPLDPMAYKFGDFRGARDNRKWPSIAHRGTQFDMPFVVDEFVS